MSTIYTPFFIFTNNPYAVPSWLVGTMYATIGQSALATNE